MRPDPTLPDLKKPSKFSRSGTNQRGLTLLEMLVVVFILSAVALMTVSFTENADGQFRFEDTRSRLERIRLAVAGEPGRTVNGGPAVSGFAADVGRLPGDIRELIEPGGLPLWGMDAATGLWAGWRGPYLPSVTESGGGRVFRDGWGNSGSPDIPDYGWVVGVDPAEGTLTVQSRGADGAAGGAGYAADYPPAGSPLVVRDDHQLNLRGWQVTVSFNNPGDGSGPALPAADVNLRVRLHFPQDGGIVSADSAAVTLTAGLVADGSTFSLTFQFDPAVDKWVPWGVRALGVVTAAGGSFPAPDPNRKQIVTLIPRTQLTPAAVAWRLE